MNKSTDNSSGWQTFYKKDCDTSKELANFIQQKAPPSGNPCPASIITIWFDIGVDDASFVIEEGLFNE